MASPTKPVRPARKTTRPTARPADRPTGGYGDAFPNSTKVHALGPQGIRVPMREIALSGGEPPLRVYDTSGPLGHDVRAGLPPLRKEWILSRDVTLTPSSARGKEPKPNGSTKGPVPAPSRATLARGDTSSIQDDNRDSRLATRDRGGANLIPETLRRPILRAQGPISQLYYARRGVVTEEMEFIALREGLPADFVRS